MDKKKTTIQVTAETLELAKSLKEPYYTRTKKDAYITRVTLDAVIHAGLSLLEKELGAEGE